MYRYMTKSDRLSSAADSDPLWKVGGSLRKIMSCVWVSKYVYRGISIKSLLFQVFSICIFVLFIYLFCWCFVLLQRHSTMKRKEKRNYVDLLYVSWGKDFLLTAGSSAKETELSSEATRIYRVWSLLYFTFFFVPRSMVNGQLKVVLAQMSQPGTCSY